MSKESVPEVRIPDTYYRQELRPQSVAQKTIAPIAGVVAAGVSAGAGAAAFFAGKDIVHDFQELNITPMEPVKFAAVAFATLVSVLGAHISYALVMQGAGESERISPFRDAPMKPEQTQLSPTSDEING